MTERRWTEDEDKLLLDNYQTMRYAQIARMIGTTYSSVQHRAFRMGLSRPSPRYAELSDAAWLPELTPVQIGYLAGMIDGEGTVSIHLVNRARQIRPRYQPVVMISGTDVRLAEHLQTMLQARYFSRERKIENYKPQWQIGWHGHRCLPILTLVQPHLIVKREQAAVVIEFITSRMSMPNYNSHYTPEQLTLYEKVRDLNVRGPRPSS